MACDECTEVRKELESYKTLYRDTLKELTELKELIYYMRPGDLERLKVYCSEQQRITKMLEEHAKKLASRPPTDPEPI